MQLDKLIEDGKRQMRICNACRYCEGYCAVWKAIEYRRDFNPNDMAYLANLCHDCRECYFACPFTEGHEYGINPPKLFSGLRDELYQKYAWPNPLSKVIGGKLKGFLMVVVAAFVLLSIYSLSTNGSEGILQEHVGEGAFYKVISEFVMIGLFVILGLWMVVGWIVGAMRFWQEIKAPSSDKVRFEDFKTATAYAASLRYLGGEGTGCSTEPSYEMSKSRRIFHHFIMYGFLLDFASTTLGAFYSHILNIPAPYPVYHPVVILGVLGGIGLIIGISGFLYVKSKGDQAVTDEGAAKSGNAFSIALLTVAVTGMLLFVLRDTAAMGMMLTIHLGTVASLFFTAPYSKFSHFVYRYLALVRYAQEERVHQAAAHVAQTKTHPVPQQSATVSK